MTWESVRAFAAREIFMPLMHAYWRTPAFSQYRELMSHETWSAERIETLRDGKLVEIMRYAATNIPYYRKVLKEKGIYPDDLKDAGSLSHFPVLTKKIIQDRHDELVNPNMSKKDYVTEHSGGSTGQPTKVRRGLDARAAVHAATWQANNRIGWNIGDSWMWLWGRLSTTEASALSKLATHCKSVLGQEVFFNIHGLDKEKLLSFAYLMRSFGPKMIVGYANAIYQLARLIREEEIGIPPLLGIATTAETLFEDQRMLIENVFGCRVFDRYASSEVGLIASECSEHEGLHLAMENIFLECVGEDGRPVPNGHPGKFLVTDLNNRAMPLIRYDLNDVGVISTSSCGCGRPYPCLEKITGRLSDILMLPGKRIVFPDDLAEIFYPLEAVRKFQVVQEEETKVGIFVVFAPGMESEALKDLIRRQMRQAIGDGVDITLGIVEDIPILASGKHRICISKVSKS